MRKFWDDVFEVVDGNRIGFVPKSSVIDRTIAIEPLMNLRLQLGVDGFIRRRLKRHDIDLDDQTKNQILASLGSELRGSRLFTYSTLDLAAASDTVSLKLCKMLLPEEWYRFLVDLRSPEGFIPGYGTVSYQKISSMGNGYTFALESAIFAAITYAVIRAESGGCDFKSDMAIYGDDIIVRERYAVNVINHLQYYGFAVNQDKSFVYGIVKESCGADWWQGHLVRPVALVKVPQTVPELFADRNRLRKVLELYFGIKESFAVSRIESWIPPFFQGFRGPVSDEEFSTYLHDPNFKKWGKYKHGRWSYRRLTIRPVEMKVNSYKSFLFKKLMCDLRGRPVTNPYETKGRSGGSQFAITVRDDNVMVGQSYRPASSIWPVKYVDVTCGSSFRANVGQQRRIHALLDSIDPDRPICTSINVH
jgi:hypothetical protein